MWMRLAAAGTLAVALVACTAEQEALTQPEFSIPLLAMGGNTDVNLGTHLTGNEEVLPSAGPGDPQPSDSRGQGQAIFRVSADGSTASFRLIASHIENVVQLKKR